LTGEPQKPAEQRRESAMTTSMLQRKIESRRSPHI